MNKEELLRALQSENINPYVYCLDGGLPAEKLCLENNYGTWSVYYSERGNRSDERFFISEAEACAYFLQTILKDPTTRMK